MKSSRLTSLAATAALVLPLAAPAGAATGVRMQDVVTPFSMQSINAYADAYTTRNGVTTVTPAPNLAKTSPDVPADRGGMQGITPGGMQSFGAGQDVYLARGGDVERLSGSGVDATIVSHSAPMEPSRAAPARTGASLYAAPGAEPPLRESRLPDIDGPDSLKGD
ncbi:MAG TPA: hypothetical protein VIH36_07675 [Casimicrobiaceae bacterium]|jgi:hypothetical protein